MNPTPTETQGLKKELAQLRNKYDDALLLSVRYTEAHKVLNLKLIEEKEKYAKLLETHIEVMETIAKITP